MHYTNGFFLLAARHLLVLCKTYPVVFYLAPLPRLMLECRAQWIKRCQASLVVSQGTTGGAWSVAVVVAGVNDSIIVY